MRSRRRAVALVCSCAVVLSLGLASCGSDDDSTSSSSTEQSTTTTMGDMPGMDHGSSGSDGTSDSSTVETSPDGCPMFMPEDVLTADQAVVTFKSSKICLGYVTVRPGTEVTWQNQGTEAAELRLFDEYPKGDNATPASTKTVPAGGDATASWDTTGSRYYVVSTLPSFVGTVEVKAE